jgi:hypothetical protein
MTQQPSIAVHDIAAGLAAALPRYDPDERRRDGSWRLILFSLLVHLGLLVMFWDSILGVLLQDEKTVLVRMIDEEIPEPKKAKPKVLARRILDTQIKKIKELKQHEIKIVEPVPVLDRAERVQLDRIKLTEAPTQIVTKNINVKRLSAFANVVRPVQAIKVDRDAPKVRQIAASRASAAPKLTEAAAPIATPRAADINAPVIARGVASDVAIDGELDGAEILALESGVDDRMVKGGGSHGIIDGGAAKSCEKDPICIAYLRMIRDRVYSRWTLGPNVAAGEVQLKFRIDRGGSAHGLKLVRADGNELGSTCLQAFRHASPFPPPPRAIHYIITKGLSATFKHGDF